MSETCCCSSSQRFSYSARGSRTVQDNRVRSSPSENMANRRKQQISRVFAHSKIWQTEGNNRFQGFLPIRKYGKQKETIDIKGFCPLENCPQSVFVSRLLSLSLCSNLSLVSSLCLSSFLSVSRLLSLSLVYSFCLSSPLSVSRLLSLSLVTLSVSRLLSLSPASSSLYRSSLICLP